MATMHITWLEMIQSTSEPCRKEKEVKMTTPPSLSQDDHSPFTQSWHYSTHTHTYQFQSVKERACKSTPESSLSPEGNECSVMATHPQATQQVERGWTQKRRWSLEDRCGVSVIKNCIVNLSFGTSCLAVMNSMAIWRTLSLPNKYWTK